MRESLQAQLTAIKQQHIQHILDAAARVFAEKGFHATSVKDVARAVGIAHGSIYNYFDNKAALLIGLFDLMTARTRNDVATAVQDERDPHAFLRAAFHHPLAALTSGNAELFRVVVSEVLVNRDLAERFRAQILDPMILTTAEILYRTLYQDAPKPADLDLRVRVMSGLVLGVILQRVLHDDVLEACWDDVPDLLADVLLQGLKGEST